MSTLQLGISEKGTSKFMDLTYKGSEKGRFYKAGLKLWENRYDSVLNGKKPSGANFSLPKIPKVRAREEPVTEVHQSEETSLREKNASAATYLLPDLETEVHQLEGIFSREEENASGDNQNGGGSYTSNGPNCSLSNGDSSVNDHPKGTHDTGF